MLLFVILINDESSTIDFHSCHIVSVSVIIVLLFCACLHRSYIVLYVNSRTVHVVSSSSTGSGLTPGDNQLFGWLVLRCAVLSILVDISIGRAVLSYPTPVIIIPVYLFSCYYYYFIVLVLMCMIPAPD